MTAIAVDSIAPPQLFDQYDRYLLPRPNGERAPHTRASTIAGVLDNRYSLEQWQQRVVAKGIAMDQGLRALAASCDVDTDKKKFKEICEDAIKIGGGERAANEGTGIHTLTETVDKGGSVSDIPEEWRDRIECYVRELDRVGLHVDPDLIERIVIDDRNQVAGRFDRGLTLDRDITLQFPPRKGNKKGRKANVPAGSILVGDVKTGGYMSWLKFTIQQATYANHTATYDEATHHRAPRIEFNTDVAAIIHLPAKGEPECRIHWVDLVEGYDAYLTALEAYAFRRDDKALTVAEPGDPFAGLEVETAAWVRDRIRTLAGNPAAVTDLRNRWPDTVPQPFPPDATRAQIDQLARVLDVVEARNQIPFGATRPGANNQKANHQ